MAAPGMFAIVYGPASPPEGKTGEEYEAAEAVRREKVVAAEEGCMLYQLVKNEDSGEYFVFELYKDQAALDAHFVNMGAKRGAIPLDKIKYETSPLKIFPVVGGYLHAAGAGEMSIANLITLPISDGAAFEAAVGPAMAQYDAGEPDTGAYILMKQPDGSTYYFMELFKDKAAVELHSGSAAFKDMGKRMAAAKANDRSRKAKFETGLAVCGSTTRKAVSAAEAAAAAGAAKL
eukprot:SAG22_NODE_1806_length_3531_cov_2.206294_3_plen_233_part_00